MPTSNRKRELVRFLNRSLDRLQFAAVDVDVTDDNYDETTTLGVPFLSCSRRSIYAKLRVSFIISLRMDTCGFLPCW